MRKTVAAVQGKGSVFLGGGGEEREGKMEGKACVACFVVPTNHPAAC